MVPIGKFNQGRNQQRLLLHKSKHKHLKKIAINRFLARLPDGPSKPVPKQVHPKAKTIAPYDLDQPHEFTWAQLHNGGDAHPCSRAKLGCPKFQIGARLGAA
jgi:hypothetical protein